MTIGIEYAEIETLPQTQRCTKCKSPLDCACGFLVGVLLDQNSNSSVIVIDNLQLHHRCNNKQTILLHSESGHYIPYNLGGRLEFIEERISN